MQDVLRWLNGWVYATFGADGLLAFSAHPLLYAAATLVALGLGGALLAWWVSRRVRARLHALRIALALATTAEGRRCLLQARQIRRGGLRLRRTVRREIENRVERRALLGVLERFTRSQLGEVLEHALRLIAHADLPLEADLRAQLERQTRAWSVALDDAAREPLQHAIAETRHRLARAVEANAARTAHLEGLAQAAAAVADLESELGALSLARRRALPEFRDYLGGVADRVGDLKSAYDQLQSPR